MWNRVLPVFIRSVFLCFEVLSKIIYIRFSKRDLLLIRYKHYILIKGYFQRFSNHAFHLLTYSVRSDSPQLFFQDLGSWRLLHLYCTGVILPRLYYVGLFDIALSLDTTVVVSYVLACFNMLYVFGRIYDYGLYVMHDLSLILGYMRSVICF